MSDAKAGLCGVGYRLDALKNQEPMLSRHAWPVDGNQDQHERRDENLPRRAAERAHPRLAAPFSSAEQEYARSIAIFTGLAYVMNGAALEGATASAVWGGFIWARGTRASV